MGNSLKDFFTEGVFPTMQTVTTTKPFRASLAGVGCFFIPGKESLQIFRVLAHESAHGLEGVVRGAEVKGIGVEYKLTKIMGTTELDKTTPKSALTISLAGLGCDIGFVACSAVVLRKISPTLAAGFLAYDLFSFFNSSDFKIYRLAKERVNYE